MTDKSQPEISCDKAMVIIIVERKFKLEWCSEVMMR